MHKTDFETILAEAVWSSYQPKVYESRHAWELSLQGGEVRLQWDPDHDPYGKPMLRKAIQLGLKGDVLKAFTTEFITGIEDITGFVKDQKQALATAGLSALRLPVERVLKISDAAIMATIRLSSFS